MGLIKRFKDWLGIVDVEVKDIDIGQGEKESVVQESSGVNSNFSKPALDSNSKEEHKEVLDKFHAEFHNPRLNCYACQERIDEGKIRFFKAGGDEERAFHKRCFKKMQKGTFQ